MVGLFVEFEGGDEEDEDERADDEAVELEDLEPPENGEEYEEGMDLEAILEQYRAYEIIQCPDEGPPSRRRKGCRP